jgi:hypothetical protein
MQLEMVKLMPVVAGALEQRAEFHLTVEQGAQGAQV